MLHKEEQVIEKEMVLVDVLNINQRTIVDLVYFPEKVDLKLYQPFKKNVKTINYAQFAMKLYTPSQTLHESQCTNKIEIDT